LDATKGEMMSSQSISDAVQDNLRELRCPVCRRLLAKEYIFKGKIELSCPRCGETHTHNFIDYKEWKKDNPTL